MFQFFFEEYKETVSRKFLRKTPWYFWALIFVPLALAAGLTFLFFRLQFPLWACYLPLGVCTLAALIWDRCVQNNRKKSRQWRKYRYRKYRIQGLIALLHQYDLCTKDGVDWLYKCCTDREQRNTAIHTLQSIEKFFVSTVFPIITLVLGIMLGDLNKTEVIQYTILILLLFAALSTLFASVKNFVSFLPEQTVLRDLKQDLGYVKTLMLQ